MFKEIFQPKHPNANIHGMITSKGEATCKTGDGKMCTGCCTGLQITEENNESAVLKEMGTDCHAQVAQKGCKYIHDNNPEGRYWVCPKYHCSSDIGKVNDSRLLLDKRVAASQRIVMENTAALHHGEIDNKTWRENLDRIPSVHR